MTYPLYDPMSSDAIQHGSYSIECKTIVNETYERSTALCSVPSEACFSQMHHLWQY